MSSLATLERVAVEAGADAHAEPVPELEFDQTVGW